MTTAASNTPISSTETYYRFVFDTKSNNVRWSLNYPLRGDFVAGLTAAITTIIRNINNDFDGFIYIIGSINGNINHDKDVIITNNEVNPEIFSEYIIARNLLPIDAINQQIPGGYYGWGIGLEKYDIYIFKSMEFVQGFITGCAAFSVDFRDYSLGRPFRTELIPSIHNEFFDIEGYDIDDVVIEVREPAVPGAYYTRTYEQYDRTGPEPQYVTDEDQGEYPIDYE